MSTLFEYDKTEVEEDITDAMVRAYKEAYLKHCEDALNGRISRRAEDFTFEASRKGIAAALSASPSPVDSRELVERLVRSELLSTLKEAASALLGEGGFYENSATTDYGRQMGKDKQKRARELLAALAAKEQQP